MKKLQIGKRLTAFFMAMLLCLELVSPANVIATESLPESNQILTTDEPMIENAEEVYLEEQYSGANTPLEMESETESVDPDSLENGTEELLIDEETGLQMQVLVLDETKGSAKSPFDMDVHMALGNKKNGEAELPTVFGLTEYENHSLLGNNYVEFSINHNTGRFTIGTVEGNINYTSDNNKILTFGHPGSTTSFTTIQINGVNYLFEADETTYDEENNRAISVMDVAGVRVIQTLEIVESESSTLKDTVRINYSVLNKSSASKNVGVRIMMDTMLGDNDGAPFKIPAVGSITQEHEYVGEDVPAYWQVFDSLSNPSVFAVGTIQKNNRIRKPDKVQYVSWGDIYGTQWDYKINSERAVTGDSAVAFYWNPIPVPAGETTSVETYYGTSLSTGNGLEAEPVEVNMKDKYVVLVTKNGGNEVLAGATVSIEGVGTEITDENGNAVFEKNLMAAGYGQRKKITISCNGYQTKEIFRPVEKSSCSAAVLKADDGKPYVKAISLTGIGEGDFADYIDLTSKNYTIEEDEKDESTYYNIRISADGNGNGNINRYKIIQNNQVIAQEDANGDSRTIRLMKNKLKAGYRIYVQVETDGGSVSKKEQTTLLVNKKITILGENSKETKGNINLGGSGIGFKIPEDAVAFGGMELNMDLPGLPIQFEAFDDGTVKVAVGLDKLGDDWEEKEKVWDELIAKYERGDDIQSVFNNYEGTTSWNVAGGFKPSFVGLGYAEGKIDDFGNCNVDLVLILGIKGEYTYTRQYIVGYVPLGFEFKTGVEGTYTAGGTVSIGESSTGKLNVDFQGNKGKLGVDIYASLYGGLGLVGVLTVGGQGEAHLLLGYDIGQQYYDAKVKGSLALTARAFMFSAKYTIAERTWNISSGYITESGQTNAKTVYDVLYDPKSYTLADRDYLVAEPIRLSDSEDMEEFFKNVYPASEPKMVLAGGTPYLFWLMDDIFRDEANRTVLVYSKYENGWSNPIAIEDDATADFHFDVAVSGNTIHVIWQDMNTVFAGEAWDAMSDEEKLYTMSSGSDISYASINITDGSISAAEKITDDLYADMLPKLVLQDNGVYAAWYTNTENDILTQTGKNEISLMQIGGEDTGMNADSVIAEFSDVPIVSLDIGLLRNKLTIAYVLDEDADLTTVSDHNLYVYDAETQQVLFKTEDDVCDANPQFAEDGSALYWYAEKQLYYINENTADTIVNAVLTETTASAAENYLLLNDNSILWTASGASEEGEILYDIYRSEQVSGVYSEPYKVIKGQKNYIGDIAACTGQETLYLAYVRNYLEQDVSDIIFEEVTSVTDLKLNHIEIDYMSVQPGNATDYIASVSNTGSTDISKITVKISNTDTGEQVSFIENVWIPKGTDAELELSHLFYQEGQEEICEYLFEVCASGESDERCMDNTEYESVGYTEISITSSTYYADDSYYTNLVMQNNTGVAAENALLRVYADEYGGAILYEKYMGTMEAYKTYAVQLDLFELAGSTAIEELYIVLSTDTEDYISGNNEEIEYLHFLWREEESYPLILQVLKEDEIYEEKVIGNYCAGDVIEVTADSFSGYDFVGWTTTGNGYFYDTANTRTYFSMPGEDTVILASYIPNAFKELERTIVVGESLLITPVYEGTWQNSDRQGATKAVYDGSAVKIIGTSEGTVQYKFVGRHGEEAQIITIHVCTVTEVNIVSEYMQNGTLKLRPGDKENLVARGIRQDGTAIELTNITWTTKNKKIADVEYSTLTGIKKGKTVLEGRIGTCVISVPVEVHIPVWSISVSSTQKTNYTPIQTTVKLKATVYGYNGQKPNNSKVTWSSSNESIATVDKNGNVKAKSVGSVSIYATAADGSGTYGSYYLNVTGKVNRINVSARDFLYGYVGYGSFNDYFSVSTTNGTIADAAVTWKSSNPSIVSVVSGAYIQMRKSGTAILTGTYGGKTAKIKVKVREYVKGVKISGKTQMAVGEKIKLTAKPTNSTAYNKNINFSISGAYNVYGESVSTSQIATITSSGQLTAKGKGYVYVRARASDEKGNYSLHKVIISAPIKKLVWSDDVIGTQKVQAGYNDYIRAYAIDKDGDRMPVEISYKSSSKAVTVESKKTEYENWIYANKPGKATITASYGGKKVTKVYEVVQPVEKVEIVGDSMIVIGETKTYKAAVTPTTASVKTVDWIITKAYDADGNITEPKKIATFTKGKLKALAEGKIVLRATSTDSAGKYALKVIEVTPPAKTLTVSVNKLSVNAGKSDTITAELMMEDGTPLNGRYITWKSSNTKVVTVENGQIQALKKGSATITASYGKKKATIKVTVTQPVEQLIITGNSSMTLGKANTLKVSALPKTVSNKKVTWEITEAWDLIGNKVENTSEIAVISNSGKITSLKTGVITVRVTAIDGSGIKSEQKVTIYGKPDTIKISGKKELRVGNSTILTATVFDEDGICAENAVVKWSSSNSKVVKVDQYGRMTAVKEGIATIKVTCDKKTAIYEVIVQ